MTSLHKKRLDQILVYQGLAKSRDRAQALIMAGLVYSGTKRLDKAGMRFPTDIVIELKGRDHPWVSRGGIKLNHALEFFEFNIQDKVCLDIGASTGGFCDVLLSRGAGKVYAVDVGHGQLAWKIRNDERVIVIERVNARYISHKEVPEKIDLVCCDVSFIGLRTILPASLKLTNTEANLVALIKPQFEVAKWQVGSKGVVRDSDLHVEVCKNISDWLIGFANWEVMGIEKSPIIGPKGNVEFLIAASRY